MRIRRFKKEDAKACSKTTITCLQEVNIKDYPAQVIENLVKRNTPEFYLNKSKIDKVFVVEDDGKVIGTGSVKKGGEY